jgi:hypothetical protein
MSQQQTIGPTFAALLVIKFQEFSLSASAGKSTLCHTSPALTPPLNPGKITRYPNNAKDIDLSLYRKTGYQKSQSYSLERLDATWELQVTVKSFTVCTPRQIVWDNTIKHARLGRVSYVALTGYVKKSWKSRTD